MKNILRIVFAILFLVSIYLIPTGVLIRSSRSTNHLSNPTR
jgi:hypothetical protein